MMKKSISVLPTVYLVIDDRRRFNYISIYIIIQCCVIFAGAITVLHCFWNPNRLPFDYYKLACIMYLFDKSTCGYSLHITKTVKNLRFSNDTMGLDVLPIKWKPAYVTVSTRLSTKARGHLEVSVALHVIWMLIAIMARFITRDNNNPKLLRYILTTFFYSCIIIVVFDLSMAIVYVAHIKQSLTKGMIIRYSGWTVEFKGINYNDFAGWLPIAASLLWMRGVIFSALNIYCCRTLYYLCHKIKKREISRRFLQENMDPIPEPARDTVTDDRVLYYRPGELKPDLKRDLTGYY